MKVVEYKMISMRTSDALMGKGFFSDEIQKEIDDNWQPLGSPFISNDWVFQALVKYEQD